MCGKGGRLVAPHVPYHTTPCDGAAATIVPHGSAGNWQPPLNGALLL